MSTVSQEDSVSTKVQYARCTNWGKKIRAHSIIPCLLCAQVVRDTIFISFVFVWLSCHPTDKFDRTFTRPHSTHLFVEVTKSSPGWLLRLVKFFWPELLWNYGLPDCGQTPGWLLVTHSEILHKSRSEVWRHICISAVEAEPKHGTATTLVVWWWEDG